MAELERALAGYADGEVFGASETTGEVTRVVLTAGLLAGTAKEAAAPWSDAKVNFVFWCANCLFGEGLRNEEATAAGTSRDLTGGGGSTPRSGLKGGGGNRWEGLSTRLGEEKLVVALGVTRRFVEIAVVDGAARREVSAALEKVVTWEDKAVKSPKREERCVPARGTSNRPEVTHRSPLTPFTASLAGTSRAATPSSAC